MTNQLNIKAKKQKIASLDKRKARGGWIFVLPFIIGFVLVYLPMILDSIKYSFSNQNPITPGTRPTFSFVGWTNYKIALTETVVGGQTYVQVLLDGLQDMIFDVPMILVFSLFMAVLLNQKMAGRAVFRAIFFVPVILATGLMENQFAAANENADAGGVDTGLEGEESSGLVSAMDFQWLLNMFSGIPVAEDIVNYVTEMINNIYDIVNRSGVQMLIFLAGLQSISPAIYESVQIDGATAWETFWKITFPMISPMILVNAVYTVIDSFTREANVVMVYINQYLSDAPGNTANSVPNVVGSAMSWMYFMVVIAVIAVVVGIMSAFVFYQRRD